MNMIATLRPAYGVQWPEWAEELEFFLAVAARQSRPEMVIAPLACR